MAIVESRIVRWKDRQADDGTPAAAWPGSTT